MKRLLMGGVKKFGPVSFKTRKLYRPFRLEIASPKQISRKMHRLIKRAMIRNEVAYVSRDRAVYGDSLL